MPRISLLSEPKGFEVLRTSHFERKWLASRRLWLLHLVFMSYYCRYFGWYYSIPQKACSDLLALKGRNSCFSDCKYHKAVTVGMIWNCWNEPRDESTNNLRTGKHLRFCWNIVKIWTGTYPQQLDWGQSGGACFYNGAAIGQLIDQQCTKYLMKDDDPSSRRGYLEGGERYWTLDRGRG